jgi:hypothetical protein
LKSMGENTKKMFKSSYDNHARFIIFYFFGFTFLDLLIN